MPHKSTHNHAPVAVARYPAAATPLESSEAGGETETAASESLAPGQPGYWAKGGGAVPYHSAYSAGKQGSCPPPPCNLLEGLECS